MFLEENRVSGENPLNQGQLEEAGSYRSLVTLNFTGYDGLMH